MIKQKKTKKKNVNVTQTTVVNIQRGKRNPRAKASAPQAMSAPQIIQPQVGSAYHQAVYGARAAAIPAMSGVPGYYAGMMSPFNAPLHIASEVQQAQLRQANELAGANVQRPSERIPVRSVERIPERIRIPEPERIPQPARRPISRLVGELEAQSRLQEKPLPFVSQLQALQPMPRSLPQQAPQQAPIQQVVEEKRKPMRYSFYPGSYEELRPSLSVSEQRPNLSVSSISFPKPSAPLSMESPEVVQFIESIPNRPVEQEYEAPEQVSSSSSSSSIETPKRREQQNYQPVVQWIDRQIAKQGKSPIGISKDAFIEQVSGQLGQQFTVANIKNKSFDEIKRRAKKFITDIIQARQ
jgi:hypothetical protein